MKYRIIQDFQGYYVQEKGWFFYDYARYAGGDPIVFETIQGAEDHIKNKVYMSVVRYYVSKKETK